MHKPVVWATILISAASVSFSAVAQDKGKPQFNDYRSQFDAQKAAIDAQSRGQWIHGKQVANEDPGSEGNMQEADYSNERRIDRDPVRSQQPDYESNSKKIGYHSPGFKDFDRTGNSAE